MKMPTNSQLAAANLDSPTRLREPATSLLSSPSLVMSSPSPRKARYYMNFQQGRLVRFHCRVREKISRDPSQSPTSCSAVEKHFQRIHDGVRKTAHPSRVYNGLLQPSHRGGPSTLHLWERSAKLDRDIQQQIFQDVRDQWRNLLEFSDRATNPMRFWFLLCKMSGKGSSPPITSQSPSMKKLTPVWKRSQEPSTGSLLSRRPPKPNDPKDLAGGLPPPPPLEPQLPVLQWEM